MIFVSQKQLEKAFDIREGHGRLKNNYATAGMPNDDPKVFAKNQKPPDMLMNAVLDVEGCMSMPAEIQVHHEEILELKESKVHLLYEIARAKSISILRGSVVPPSAPKPPPARELTGSDTTVEELKKEIDRLKARLTAASNFSGSKQLTFTSPINGVRRVWSSIDWDWIVEEK